MINQVKLEIKKTLKEKLNINETDIILEAPKRGNSDLAIPLFSLAKTLQLSIDNIYDKFLQALIPLPFIEKVELLAGFFNIYLKKVLTATSIINTITKLGHNFASTSSINKTVVIDYSAPNIAKNFSVGHLRSTMIGNALKNIYQKCGFNVVGINHLGDWGTQFGRMIVAYQKWGNKDIINSNPVTELQNLYTKFHDELENDQTLEELGREAFLKLEQNDPTNLALWQWFREVSLQEFMKMYELLKVDFDSYDGEAFFNDKMDSVIKELEKKKLLVLDQGAMIVPLTNIPPALIKRTDGATLYMTRDLAALLYRYQKYHFSKILYVVGNEQKLHFEQLKQVADKMGYNFDIEHIKFGLVLVDGKKMSTRKGKFAKLRDVIYEAKNQALDTIAAKNPTLQNKEETALSIALGAIIFNDLKNEKHLDIDFNLANMLKFEGQTGPYLQYALVRINSILKDQVIGKDIDFNIYENQDYYDLTICLDNFNDAVAKALEKNAPSIIARYLLVLASNFSSFYAKHKILVDNEKTRNTNLLLINAIKTVLEEGLRLLGIDALTAM